MRENCVRCTNHCTFLQRKEKLIWATFFSVLKFSHHHFLLVYLMMGKSNGNYKSTHNHNNNHSLHIRKGEISPRALISCHNPSRFSIMLRDQYRGKQTKTAPEISCSDRIRTIVSWEQRGQEEHVHL